MQEQVFTSFNFAGLPLSISSWDDSRAVIIPVPYDLTTTYTPGARRGPLAIIEASSHMELFDDEINAEIASIGIHTHDQLEPISTGPQNMIKSVENVVARIINSNKFPVVLGGEHSISLGAIRAVNKKYPNCGVVQFDAHADLRHKYLGSKFNHACVGRRISEISSLTQVGVRSFSKEEFDFLNHSGIETYFAKDICGNNKSVDKILKKMPPDIYITLDLDVLDPSIMPSVGTPEPGGLGWYEILHLLKLLSDKKNILGYDIVELCPQPGNPGPDFLAAKLCYKLLGYIFAKKISIN